MLRMFPDRPSSWRAKTQQVFERFLFCDRWHTWITSVKCQQTTLKAASGTFAKKVFVSCLLAEVLIWYWQRELLDHFAQTFCAEFLASICITRNKSSCNFLPVFFQFRAEYFFDSLPCKNSWFGFVVVSVNWLQPFVSFLPGPKEIGAKKAKQRRARTSPLIPSIATTNLCFFLLKWIEKVLIWDCIGVPGIQQHHQFSELWLADVELESSEQLAQISASNFSIPSLGKTKTTRNTDVFALFQNQSAVHETQGVTYRVQMQKRILIRGVVVLDMVVQQSQQVRKIHLLTDTSIWKIPDKEHRNKTLERGRDGIVPRENDQIFSQLTCVQA